MKKLLALVIALMMVMALSVTVFADYSYDFTDTNDDGWWENPGLANDADLVAALKEAGAKLVITINNGDAATNGFQYGFQDTTSWVNILVHSNFENGEGNVGPESVSVVDGNTVVVVDGAALVAAAEAAGSDLTTWQWVNGSSTGNTVSIAVSANVAAPAEPETTPEPETPAPSTGLALAVVPAVMALAAVAVSKKH